MNFWPVSPDFVSELQRQDTRTIGIAVAILGENGTAGGFTEPGLRAFLLNRLTEESDPGVHDAIVSALGVRHAPATWQALVDRLVSAMVGDERDHALGDLVVYLNQIEAPEVPGSAEYKIDPEDGKVSMEVNMGGRGTPRPELWQPVVDLAVLSDGSGDDTALAFLAPGTGGFRALGQVFESNDTDFALALNIAERCVACFPQDVTVRWWRGMVRDNTGDADGGLEDLEFVASQAPQFGYPFRRIAKLRLAKGELDAARVALAKAQELIPEDPQVKELAVHLRS